MCMEYGMSTNKWHFLFVDGFKGHYVPAELADDLRAELLARADTDFSEGEREQADLAGIVLGNIRHDQPRECAYADLPGLCLADAVVWVCPTTKFSCPVTDFAAFEYELRDAPLREFNNGAKYYKIHGWRQCIMFTPAWRDAVLANMAADRDVVLAQAAAERIAVDRVLYGDVRADPIGGAWS